jgi:hypothetical protein
LATKMLVSRPLCSSQGTGGAGPGPPPAPSRGGHRGGSAGVGPRAEVERSIEPLPQDPTACLGVAPPLPAVPYRSRRSGRTGRVETTPRRLVNVPPMSSAREANAPGAGLDAATNGGAPGAP